MHEPITTATCGMPLGRHARLVEEDPAEVIAVGEHLGLQRQERAARVDQVDAGQAVLERDLLRAHVLLHRHRVVRAALHRGVVGDDDHFAAGDAADAGDDARARRVVCRTCRTRQAATARGTASRDRAAARCARGRAACPAGGAARRTSARRPGAPRPRCSRSSATSASIRARLARNSSLDGSMCVSIGSIQAGRPALTSRSSPSCSRSRRSARRRACGTRSRGRTARRRWRHRSPAGDVRSGGGGAHGRGRLGSVGHESSL